MLLEGFLGCEFVGMFLQNLKICVSLLCFLFDFLLCVLQVHDRCKHSGGGKNLCLHSPKGLPGFILLGIAFDDWRPESVRGINAAFVVRFCSVCKIFIWQVVHCYRPSPLATAKGGKDLRWPSFASRQCVNWSLRTRSPTASRPTGILKRFLLGVLCEFL